MATRIRYAFPYLQTLGGALSVLSVADVGGAAVEGQKPKCGSTKPGAVAAVLGKG